MQRRQLTAMVAAVGAGSLAFALLTPYDALGKQSDPKLSPQERFEVCHEGKTIKIYPDEWYEHYLHGDTFGPCPKG